jgi:outer membrane lipoprotein-sorting protein
MPRLLAACSLLLLLAGCPKKDETTAQLLSQVKQGLTDRDSKVQSYRLAGMTREQGLEAKFEFEYRAPNKMKGELKSPQARTFSYDGEKLFEVLPDEKKFVAYDMKLPPEKSALFLTQTFSPFAPEGFRAPLLLREGLTVSRSTHPKAPEAIEVKLATVDEAGQSLNVTYVFRWPALDFLSKKMESGGNVMEVRVDDEQCEAALKLCFPRQLTHWEGKNPAATTTMSKIEINPIIPNGQFTLVAPEGFEEKVQALVEQK